MSYSPITIAACFTQLASAAKTSLTQMQLQKLTYIAHGFKLATTGGEPLVSQPVTAWKFGPVFPDLYHSLKNYGGLAVRPFYPSEQVSPFDMSLLKAVFNIYGKMSGVELSERTHMSGTPWHTIWHGQNGCNRINAIIPDAMIMDYYRGMAPISTNPANALNTQHTRAFNPSFHAAV